MEKKFRYLVPGDYMADPAVHVFDGKLYIYPSHDRESGVEENDNERNSDRSRNRTESFGCPLGRASVVGL